MTVPAARLVTTAHVAAWAEGAADRTSLVAICIRRHLTGDWGDVDQHDWAINDRAVRLRSGRVLSAFRIPPELRPTGGDGHLWVITDDLDDPDTATTILFPSDY